MSRRKQSKPQQHLGVNCGEENNKVARISLPLEVQATTRPEEPSCGGIDGRMHLDRKDDGSDSPMPSSELHICTNCQGEFIGTTQFLAHREKCTQRQVVVIMNDQKEETNEIKEEPVRENGDANPDIMDTNEENGGEGVLPKSLTSLFPQVNHMEDSREDEKQSEEQQRPIYFSSAQTVDQNENTRPEDGLPETKEVPGITTSVRRWGISGTNSSNSSSWSLPATSSGSSTNPAQVLCDITGRTNLGEKQNGIVKSNPSSVAVIREQLHTLHQQHLQQLHIIIQIQVRIQALVDESLKRGVDVTSKENAKESVLPSTIKPRAQPVGTSTMHPTPPPHPNVPSTIQILQNQVRQTPSLPFPAFPLSSPHSPFDLFQPSHPGLGTMSNTLQVSTPLPYPGGLLSHRKGKSPNVSVSDPKFTDDAFFRHKCHFCHKVFGSDSALQIHIRSHTGERPFRCNICGNRFSTKGNLKVHFQRHQTQYPDVEMDITPYPPSPILHDQQPLPPPSIDQVPMPSIPSESIRHISDDSSYQQEVVPSSQNKHDMSDINNNDELSVTQKFDVEEMQIDTRIETTSSDGAVDIGRPRSAPSKVITSNPLSLTDTYMQIESNGAALNERAGKDPEAVTSVIPTSVDEDPMRTSDTLKLHHLVENIEQKIAELNQCVICHKVLSCKNALELHYRTHTGERPFKCNICGRMFTTKGNLKTHYSVHKTELAYPLYNECTICHKNFVNPILLQQHLKMHAAEDQMMHSTFGQESYSKEVCGLQRKPKNLMESLKARRFNYMEVLMNSDKPDLTRHLEEREEIYVKRQKFSDSEIDGISSTQMEKERYLQYPMCHPEKVTDEERAHSENSHPIIHSNSGEPKRIMYEAGSHSEGALDLTPKTTSSSPDSVRSDPLPLTTSSRDHQKPRSEGFRPASDSDKASSDNDIELKPYTNGEMRQIFDLNIPSFLMVRHRNRSNTTCYFCGKTFACASALNIHYRSHTKERPFKCDVCCKGFSTRGNLKQHMLTHKIRDMPSQLLGMGMTTTNSGTSTPNVKVESSSAGIEAQTPTPAEEIMDSKRPISNRHQCGVCDKPFQSDSALQIHVRTHTGEKPYKCHICGRAFTTKGNMKVHMGTHMWNGRSRRGRRITMDPPLLMNHKGHDIYRNDTFGGFRPNLNYQFFQYSPPHSQLNGFQPLGKRNEISVIQNPHNMGLHYPLSSESPHPKNGSTDSLSSSDPRSNSSGGSGYSSPNKESSSPSAYVEHHLQPEFPPSMHSPASLNYLNLIRLSRGAASTRHSLMLSAQTDVKTSMYSADRPLPGDLTSETEARMPSLLGYAEREAKMHSPHRS